MQYFSQNSTISTDTCHVRLTKITNAAPFLFRATSKVCFAVPVNLLGNRDGRSVVVSATVGSNKNWTAVKPLCTYPRPSRDM
jgi:hypothetical protein